MPYPAETRSGCLSLSAVCKRSFEAGASAGCGRCAAMRQATTGSGCTGCSSTTASRTTSSMQRVSRSIAAPSISKTDNIDAKRLLKAIVGFVEGDPQSCRVVRAPTPEEEDARRLHRERQRLVRERTGHLNRIKALLITHGIRALRITDAKWCERLDKMQTGDGRPIPARLKIEIEREWKRLKMVAEQIRAGETERDRLVKGTEPSGDACSEKMRRLVKLHGIGAEFATVLTREVFYRPFQNRRQVASYVGLTPAPYDSGETKHDQGINQAGKTRARVIAVQMAWFWLRDQLKSELSLSYY